MNCMKCGVELKDSGVFCEACLADMEKYPVQSNIAVQLPRRPVSVQPKKKARRQRYVKPEDQIRHLKRVRNGLCILLAASMLAFALSASMVLYLLNREESSNIGQNYETYGSIDN